MKIDALVISRKSPLGDWKLSTVFFEPKIGWPLIKRLMDSGSESAGFEYSYYEGAAIREEDNILVRVIREWNGEEGDGDQQ